MMKDAPFALPHPIPPEGAAIHPIVAIGMGTRKGVSRSVRTSRRRLQFRISPNAAESESASAGEGGCGEILFLWIMGGRLFL